MSILKVAFSQLGEKEILGDQHNDQILKYASESGILGIGTDEIPWCSNFVNWCAMKANLPKSGKPNARSWLKIGNKVTHPIPGDIVIFWRGSIDSWQGHVAIFLGFNQSGTKVHCLGGNQGNAVSVDQYSSNRILGYRKLEGVSSSQIPEPTLKIGDNGVEVIKLQNLLNQFDCNCGDPDGDFGQKTNSALRLYQANNGLTIDGIYGFGSKKEMESDLQNLG